MNVSISRNGTEIGEWTEDQVRALLKEGQLLASDHYWKEGMTEWASIATFLKPPLAPNQSLPKSNMNATHLVILIIRFISVYVAWIGIHAFRNSFFLYAERHDLGAPYWIAPDDKAVNWTETSSVEWQHLLTYGTEAFVIAGLLWFFSSKLAFLFTKGLPKE